MSKKNQTFLEKVGEVVHDLTTGMFNAGPEKKAVHPVKKSAKKSAKKSPKKADRKAVKKAPKKAAKKAVKKSAKRTAAKK
jgi:hypothetical protein